MHTVIGTVGHDMLVRFSWTSVQLNFGAPKHIKSQLDGDFGVLSRVRHLASLRRMLVDVDDVAESTGSPGRVDDSLMSCRKSQGRQAGGSGADLFSATMPEMLEY